VRLPSFPTVSRARVDPDRDRTEWGAGGPQLRQLELLSASVRSPRHCSSTMVYWLNHLNMSGSIARNHNSCVSGQARVPQFGNPLKPLLPSCTRKGAVAELIVLGMGTTKGICEEQNGQPQSETLNRKAWVKRIDQTGAGLP
jgi:hypothetical protein